MCMLCVVPPNVIPSRDKLENSALNNPHGFGYAIAIPKEKRIHTFRSMNADECINKFVDDRGKYLEGYAIWHARYATHGSNTLDNCHPFMVGKDKDSYLAHNGIINVVETRQKDERSDTRIFAEELLPSIGGVKSLDNPQVWNMLEDFTTGSKVAILTVNPEASHQLYLLHEEKGMTDASGVWWSNNSCYLESWYAKSYKLSNGVVVTSESGDDTEWLECQVCENVQEYWESLKTGTDSFCSTCGSCFMCSVYKTNCLCFQGGKVYDNRTLNSHLTNGSWQVW